MHSYGENRIMNFSIKYLYQTTTSVIKSLCRAPETLSVISVRFYERRRFIRRFGYRPKYHAKGLLPRIKDDPFPLRCLPHEKKPDPWRRPLATFGQNDYIDILGGDRVNPTQTMSSIPFWLRKFKGNEMQMLIRKRHAKKHWSWFRPEKWNQLNKRIDFLYKRLNYKQPPRPPEYPSNY